MVKIPRVVYAEQQAVVGGIRGSFGSVISYVLKCNAESPNYPQYQRDPIAAVERAISRKEKLHWFNPSSSVITNDVAGNMRRQAEWAAAPIFAMGDLVCLEGRVFELAPDFNRNVRLVPVQSGVAS